MVYKPNYNKDKYLFLDIKDRKGNHYSMRIHAYLYGLTLGGVLRKKHKWHNMILVTGNVGDGKSTLVKGLAGLSAILRNSYITLEKNFCWTDSKLIEMTDKEDNYDEELIWDEAIQGAGGRALALTDVGNKLKKAVVTKRTKRHNYYFCIDEIEEYSWKFIKMCSCWIHIYSKGINRGYFSCYTSKKKIKYIYWQMKLHKRGWDSREIKNCNPDSYGKFDDWENVFVDEKEYEKLKIEQTRQSEEEKEKNKEKIGLRELKNQENEELIKKIEIAVLGNPQIKTSELRAMINNKKSSGWVRDIRASLLMMHARSQKN